MQLFFFSHLDSGIALTPNPGNTAGPGRAIQRIPFRCGLCGGIVNDKFVESYL